MAQETPVQISVTRTTAVRPPTAFATLADIAKWPAMIGSVKGLELLNSGPIRVGTRIRAQRIMLGRETTEEMEIVEIERPRRLRLASNGRDLQYERDHIIDAIHTGSRMTLIWRPRPATQVGRAVLPFITPFMEIKLRNELEQDLADLAAAISALASKPRNAAGG